jgi:hypothetical protein
MIEYALRLAEVMVLLGVMVWLLTIVAAIVMGVRRKR